MCSQEGVAIGLVHNTDSMSRLIRSSNKGRLFLIRDYDLSSDLPASVRTHKTAIITGLGSRS